MTNETTSDPKVRQSLEQEIRNNPDDDSSRLIYADWLRDHASTPSEKARVQLIRAQVELANPDISVERRISCEIIERACLERFRVQWLQKDGFTPEEIEQYNPQYQRGLVGKVTLTPKELTNGTLEKLQERAPITGVKVKHKGQSFNDDIIENPYGENHTPVPALTRLRELEFDENSHIAPVSIYRFLLCPDFSGVTTLTLRGIASPHPGPGQSSVNWLQAIAGCPLSASVKNLALQNCALHNSHLYPTPDDCSTMFQEDGENRTWNPERFRNLRRLDLSSLPHLPYLRNGLSTYRFPDGLQSERMKNLRELNLSGSLERDVNGSEICAGVLERLIGNDYFQLTSLDISRCGNLLAIDQTGDTPLCLFNLLSDNKNNHLRSLNVSGMEVGDDFVKRLCRSQLPLPLPELEHLDISWTNPSRHNQSAWTAETLAPLFENNWAPNLRSLEMGGNPIPDPVENFKKFLNSEHLPNLVSLEIQGSVGKRDAGNLNEAIRNSKIAGQLLRLDVSQNDMGENNLAGLLEGGKLPKLQELIARGIKFTPGCAAALSAVHPLGDDKEFTRRDYPRLMRVVADAPPAAGNTANAFQWAETSVGAALNTAGMPEALRCVIEQARNTNPMPEVG